MSNEQRDPVNAARDSRTRLPDRDSFYRDVQPLIEEADTSTNPLVLLVIDIYGLDFVLRTFGPDERDLVIREVGRRIRDVTEDAKTPYHITQNRFALLLPACGYLTATRHSQAFVDTLKEPFFVSNIPYYMDAHVGISNYPNHADSINELVRTAVFACYQAKKMQADFVTFDSELDERERHRFRLMTDLEHSLKNNGDIRLAYQPQVDMISGRCIGAEGLCRWQHSVFGMIPPMHFLPFVEQTSLMMPFTEATLSEGLEELACLRSNGFNGHLSINLSPALFRKPDLLERLLEHFRFSNLNLEKIHFEVTETGIIEQPNKAINILSELRDRGSRISVDDFGTGHSSLAYLADLPVDTIKIDKHFVQNLSQPWGEAIVGAAATLAQKLGLATVAEGIETESDYEKCRELGVDIGQGFYIGRPMFSNEFHQWLDIH